MSDWIYHTYTQNVEQNFSKVAAAKKQRREIVFADELQCLNPEFGLIRGIANAAKHLELRTPGPHPAAPSHAANVASQMTGFGQGGFGQGPWDGSARIMLAGPQGNDIEFSELVLSVHEMWLQLSAKYNWCIH